MSPSKYAPIPSIIYGTAWKKEKTTDLVYKAISLGYRSIDTACQPKHYSENLVGLALSKINNLNLNRNQLFIQTKFTSIDGQDPKNIPYDKNLPLNQQVQQSFKKSLLNLQTEYIDSILIHSPMKTHADTMIVWKEFENFHSQGLVRFLGVSNCYSLRELKKIYDDANIKPKFLQNRFYSDSGYDIEIREFCKENEIIYQSFWTLSANPEALNSIAVMKAAKAHDKTVAQIWFRFCVQLGITPLTGTTNEHHMKDDLNVFQFELSSEEMNSISKLIYN